jgi:hypothetical protein
VLAQNHPNPFRDETEIRFRLPAAQRARLTVYDARGRRVAVLADGEHAAGWHAARMDGRQLAAGRYVVLLETGGRSLSRHLTLLH